jgi:non-ribosomal peptide synthetase component F
MEDIVTAGRAEGGQAVGAAPLTPSWHAEAAPDAPAIVMGATGETVTYAQLEDRSTRLARALAARGLTEGYLDGDGYLYLTDRTGPGTSR